MSVIFRHPRTLINWRTPHPSSSAGTPMSAMHPCLRCPDNDRPATIGILRSEDSVSIADICRKSRDDAVDETNDRWDQNFLLFLALSHEVDCINSNLLIEYDLSIRIGEQSQNGSCYRNITIQVRGSTVPQLNVRTFHCIQSIVCTNYNFDRTPHHIERTY